jgi:hypothetical protein
VETIGHQLTSRENKSLLCFPDLSTSTLTEMKIRFARPAFETGPLKSEEAKSVFCLAKERVLVSKSSENSVPVVKCEDIDLPLSFQRGLFFTRIIYVGPSPIEQKQIAFLIFFFLLL